MIYLDSGGEELACEVKYETTFTSRHTGNELKSIKVDVIIKTQQTHEILLISIKKGSINSTDGNGTILNRWKVKNTSFSYTDTRNSPYYHSLELEEIEELEVSSLALGGFSVQPYLYEERFDGDALIIEANVLLSDKQYMELKELMKGSRYFPVIRHGISNESKEMRFGLMRWSKHDEGIKHELLLVEKSYDEANKRFGGLYEPQMSNIQHMVAECTELLDELLTTLVNKSLLSKEEEDNIRIKAATRIWERKRELFLVDDIDN